jgi:hypothetical protein
MQTLHNILIGAGGIILDSFKPEITAERTITVPSSKELESDFGRISADLNVAMQKAEHAGQLEFAL